MIYKQQSSIGGKWVKGSEVIEGTKCKLVSETEPRPSQFKDRNGNMKMQDVSKIRFQGSEESLNISINRATLNALIDAFGEDSKNWVGRVLTAHTERVMVGGKRQTSVFLIPEGYEVKEDDNGFVYLFNPNKPDEKEPEPPDEEINVEDIPF